LNSRNEEDVMAIYSVRVLRGGQPVEGAEVVFVGERRYAVTGADGVISANLGAYSDPLGIHVLISAPALGIEAGGGPYRIEPGVIWDIEV